MEFKNNTFKERLKSMIKVDFRRMFTMPLFYIMLGISLVVPILILVMTSMMDGMVTTNPQTGVETTIKGFDNVWQIISTVSNAPMSMDITSMCNINMLYFGLSVLVCLYVGEDFRSGYCKNLFTNRSNKNDYVISKTIVLFISGGIIIIGFFVGSMLGGVLTDLSFELNNVSYLNIIMCLIAKVLLVAIFVSLFLLFSIIGKQKIWMSILLSIGSGMLMFMMIPIITPLDATIIHVILCLVGSLLFAIGLGIISNVILKNKSIL